MSTHATDPIGVPGIEQTVWRIDPDRSSVEFNAKVWGIATVKGGFTRYRGTLDLSGDPAVELIVEADSLDTKNARRDKHLSSPDFFGVEQHPYIRFVSESAALVGERLEVRGVLPRGVGSARVGRARGLTRSRPAVVRTARVGRCVRRAVGGGPGRSARAR